MDMMAVLFAPSPRRAAPLAEGFRARLSGATRFCRTPSDARTFHQRALEEGRFYEERVAGNLSSLSSAMSFRACQARSPPLRQTAPLQEVREAALILLYRLLFILYAEDRDLLPVRDDAMTIMACARMCGGTSDTAKTRNDMFSDNRRSLLVSPR